MQDRIGKHQSVCLGRSSSPHGPTRRFTSTPGRPTKLERPKSTVPTSGVFRSMNTSSSRLQTQCASRTSAKPRALQMSNRSFGSEELHRYDIVTRESTRRLGSGSGYPGANRMAATERWDGTSNASSAGNPLVTNRMMTYHSVSVATRNSF